MNRILKYLMHEESILRDRLNEENLASCKSERQMLEIVSKGRAKTLIFREAALAALLVPHEQLALPTCTIDSLINA
jgi:hypothetical protein